MSTENQNPPEGGPENPPPESAEQNQQQQNPQPEQAPAAEEPAKDQEQNEPQKESAEQPEAEGEAPEQKEPEKEEAAGDNVERKKTVRFTKRNQSIKEEPKHEEPQEDGQDNIAENEAEEMEEEEENEDAGNSSERKENDYNSKELEDFITICNFVVKPLEQKDVINRSLTNFQNNIKNSIDQIDKNFTLQKIDLPNQPDEVIAKDNQLVKVLDGVVKTWTDSIQNAQTNLTNYPKNITNAMMEIDNRKRAVSNWSILAQQLKGDNIERIVRILKLSDEPQKGKTFETKIAEFENTFEDANDYLKFLQTLERSIKDLASDDLAVIEHSIPGIFHNLKIIWMISKHKGPNKFGFLLEVMAKEIWTKISEKVQLKSLFKTNPDEIDQSINLITQASKVAIQWISHYNDTKNKTKWEYAHNKITKDLDYVKETCAKLKKGLKKIKGFLKFLGHDLERVIGGASERIYNEKEKVVKAYSYFEEYPYNIFNSENEKQSKEAFANFDRDMKGLEEDTRKLIDDTFDNLKNAESAFDLYTNFDSLIDQTEIKSAMKDKYLNILRRFIDEVKNYEAIFLKYKDNPPISKAKSETAGKIAWARQLYVKMKRPISKIFHKKDHFKQIADNPKDDKLQTEKELADAFLKVARQLRDYEFKIFDDWKANSLSQFMGYLRLCVLIKKDNGYEVNFDNKLKLMIHDTKFLDLYGFSDIPPNIINIAHQEIQLAQYCNMLSLMLRDYDNLTKSMKEHHQMLLAKDCKDLNSTIEVGTTTHNWTALGIKEFNDHCKNGIKNLRDKFANVIKSEEKILSVIKQISNATLVRDFNKSIVNNRELNAFLFYYEEHRQKVIGELLNKYQEITTTLIDIQRMTFEGSKEDSSTAIQSKGKGAHAADNLGERPEMSQYYHYWENCMLNALSKCILKAIITLNELFSMDSTTSSYSMKQREQNVLFTVKSKFISFKEVLYNPAANEIDLELKSRLISSFQNTGREFIRWMDGTCKTPSLELAEEKDKEYIRTRYSYGTEIADNQDLKTYINKILNTIGKITLSLDNNKEKYIRDYSKDYFGFWGQNARSRYENELEKNKTLKNFEKKVSIILFNLDDFEKKREKQKLCTGNFLINNEELITRGKEQIGKVKNDMLKILVKELEEEEMKKFNEIIASNKEKLKEKTESSDELKKVLGYVSKIRGKKLNMELKIHSMSEKIHFLKLHDYPGLSEIEKHFKQLRKEWENLRVKAKRKDDNLLERKKNLAKNTEKDAELLQEDIKIEYKNYNEKGPLNDIELGVGYKILLESNEKLALLKKRKEDIVGSQKLFNLPITTFPEINEMHEKNKKVEPIYKTFHEFDVFFNDQQDKTWSKLETSLLEKKNDELLKAKRDFERKGLVNLNPFKKYETVRENFNDNVKDIILLLKSPVVNERNLAEFIKENRPGRLNVKFDVMTLRDVMKLDLLKDKEKVATMVNDAKEETDVKNKLDEIKTSLDELKFQLAPHKRGNEDKGYKFKDVSGEMEIIKDNIENLQNVGANKHAKAFKNDIEDLEQEMNNMMEIIEIWVEVQKKWIYLESIFVGSEDIRQKLVKETQEFDVQDKNFRKLMTSIYKKPSVRFQCRENGRKFELKGFLNKFEQAEKALTKHLDSKKNEFSRFYFLTEQDLLQIIGSSDPLDTLNPHLIKIYSNCKKLLSERRNIIGMISQEGEKLYFDKAIRVESQQQVGQWMNKVDDEMKNTLRNLLKTAIQDYTKEELYKFIHNKLGQIAVFTSECWWTFALEDVFRKIKNEGDKYAMKRELERQSKGLLDLVIIVRKKDICKEDRLKLNNLIIRTVHGREIVDKFVRDSILDAREFEWESQLKFYWDREKDDLIIRQCNGEFCSCYEYQGLEGRLVITPLTDRCVMTITTALTFFLGTAPAGPAGTGKTETVKDLGKGMGIRVVVQNCSDTLDYLFMGQFFSGLSQTGFWGCFDEFNMINREVLSVVTTQINSIELSLAQHKESWFLMTKEVKLLPTIGIFITMNPNYAGRSELPDNLKALFRPVTMVTPDFLLICENILLSFGFEDGRKLAQKICKLYELSQEQLSKQHHYEWGLRSMKAVLSSAGTLKRNNLEMKEDLILMKAMKDLNMPKFIRDDSILFEGLLKDLFPDLDSSELKERGEEVVQEVMKNMGLKVLDGQVLKVLQMYEVMNIRHCTMICGPPMSGKSVIIDILRNVFQKFKKIDNMVTYLINPKAQSVPRLFGKKNEISDDFEIGILSNIFQIANSPLPSNGKSELRWIILDGDVDPLWIEKLNSVMDDSKQLTLENKDRILMQSYCSMLVEAFNIHHASPATISRLGMIYVDSSLLHGDAVFYKWLEAKDPKEWDETIKGYMNDNYTRMMPPCLKYVLKGAKGTEEEGIPFKLIVPQYEAAIVNQLTNLIDSMLVDIETVPSEAAQLESIFTFCLVWSVGACLTCDADREKFGKFLKDLPSGTSTPPSKPYDSCYDISGGRFIEWDSEALNNLIIPETDGKNKPYNEIIIPTSDTKKFSYLLKNLLNIHKPVLFVGESGTGKTVTINNYLKFLTKEKNSPYVILNMNFSSRTNSTDFQNTMEEILETRFLRTMGPPSGKELIIYVDDLGMPKIDTYETQQPIAFMKLLIEKKCYYTKDNKDLIKLIDTNFVGSTLPPGGGNNNIDPRFISLFSVFNISIDNNAVSKIYDIILTNYLSGYPEESDMASFKDKLIAATVQLYSAVKAELPRTPIKFHYVFNIRDISKIFQGFCLLTKENFPTKESLLKLWRHEALRVLSDKLRENNDQKKVEALIESNINANFSDLAEEALSKPCLHCDFMKVNFYDEEVDPETKVPKMEERFYQNVESYEVVKKFLDSSLEAYKDFEGQAINLVFYDECIDHLLRIHRIIRIQDGNALLVGVGGSGKQSLTKIATFIARYELWGIKITSKFEEKHFREQLLELFRKFIEQKPMRPITFLFTDEQVLDEGFLELINNILTTGIVPAIFEKSEKGTIIDAYKPLAAKLNLPETKDAAYGLYVNRIRENLHLVISMSPSGDNLRNRCRNFPGLISSTTIDWFFEWPKEALLQVANFLFNDYKNIEKDNLPILCDHIIGVHLSLKDFSAEAYNSQKRNIYTTPKNFLDYIKNFQNLYKKHLSDTQELIKHLENGLSVLADSSKNIAALKKTVGEEEENAAKLLVKLNEVLTNLKEATEKTTKNKTEAEAKEKELTQKNKEISKSQDEINTSLINIKALIEKVKEEVKKIDQGKVDMMAKLQRFEGENIIVKALIFTIKDVNVKWDAMPDSDVASKLGATKKLFSDLVELDKTFMNILDKVGNINQCEVAYNKVKDIQVDKNKNKTIYQLQQYVINFFEFATKSKKRVELEKNLQIKIDEKEKAEKSLRETKEQLEILTKESERLQKEKDENEQKYNIANERLKDLSQRLSTANSLFDGLKSEQVRWSEDKVNLGNSKDKLVGDCLLGAAFLSYCGPFSFDFRRRMIYDAWKADLVEKKINVTETFTVQGLLTSDQEISQWNIDGLPDDELSTQNGILTENANRWPLAIDPENQAVLWYKKKSGATLKIVTFNTENYMKYVGLKVHNGGTILIENVGDTLDPNINPVLEKNYIIKNQVEYIMLDGQEQSVSSDFKLYLVTKLPNPHYTPEIMAKTTIINFSITMDGLEEQLLNEVVRFEYPSIEETRKSIVESMNKNKIFLKKCEDNLLEALNESAGTDILKNSKLIETLKFTKDKAQELKASLQASETTRKDLYLQRANYIPVAKRGSILYFTICGLRLISSMYEYSLAAYTNVYRNAIKEAPPNMILTNRLDSIKKKLTNLLYEYICLSIFGKHKLMFSFHMRTMIMRYEEELDMNELLFFLRGSISESKNQKPDSLDWLSDASWLDLEGLINLNERMRKVGNLFKNNSDEWKAWIDLEKPEDVELPSALEEDLTPLEKLLVVRVFRKDRVFNAIKNFIRITTGNEYYITPPPMKMNKIFDQSSVNTPVLFILSPGVDPSYYVNQYAIEMGYFEKKYRFMSLGQKQETEAKNMIMDGIKRGLWILLQNCDLLFKWLKELEKIIDSVDSLKPKPEFRLWLTTSPMDNFPIGILHKSFKVVTEPPDGLGPNMNRVFGSMKAESFENECPHPAYKPLVFVISFFHSVMQDRKKFGKIGWNVIYDFMESDFTISKRLLSMYLGKISNDDPIPWASLKYLIGEAMYGGRVTDDYDRRVMMTYLSEYMGDFIFDVNQKFFFAKSENYNYEIPEEGPFDNYVKCINEMPITYSPEIIGLHSNAEIDYFTQASKRIWEDMIKLQSSTGSGTAKKKEGEEGKVKAAETKEEVVLKMAEEMKENKLPPKFEMLVVNKKFTGGKTPIDAVLTQEIERYNMLNDKMSDTLTDLISSLKGEIAMNNEIEEIMNSIYNGLLPNQWRNLAPETQKSLLNWLEHFRRRYNQYLDWFDNGEPKVMWLSGLHIPASYLKAIIQTTCRKKGWPLDKVSTYTVVTKIFNVDEISAKPEFGCYIQGLYLEGAEWDSEKNCLQRQLPKKLVCNMPLIQVIPAEASKIKLRNNLKTPVYVTQNRKNVKGEGFVFEADLRTLVHPNLWILQGVALLLNTVYG